MDESIKLSDIVFLDMEASGLGDCCFPIEIGFVAALDLSGWWSLIRPPPSWLRGKCWDAKAEGLHGLSLDEIHRDGSPVEDVAVALNRALAGKQVFCDEPDFVRHWLSMVSEAARMHTNFELWHTQTLFLHWSRLVSYDAPLQSDAPAKDLRRHRAYDDAYGLATGFRGLLSLP